MENVQTQKFAGVRLNPGISIKNLLTFYFLTFIGLQLMFYVNASKDFLLTTFLRIPSAEQGQVAGNLGSLREAVLLVMIAVGGILADRIGRKTVCIVGFLLLSLGYLLFPLASTVNQLLPFYFISAIGAAFITGTMSTLIADYVLNQDRGKASGFQGVLIGFSIPFVGLVLKPLPKYFQNAGLDEVTAGRYAYFVVAALGVLAALILWYGLKGGTVTRSEEKRGFASLVREGIAAARQPGIALAYFSAFVSRGDLAAVGLFLSLWISKFGRAQGLDSATAAASAGKILAVAGLAYLVAAPLIGVLTDRFNRVQALMIAAFIGFLAYGSAVFVSNPLGPAMYFFSFAVGIAQISGVITSQVLIAQQAPTAIRGSVIGFFGLCGAAAQIFLGFIGGYLFDGVSEAAPFVIVGFLNLVLFGVAFGLKNRMSMDPNGAPDNQEAGVAH